MYFESSSFETKEAGIKQKQWEELSRTFPRLGSPTQRHREIYYCILYIIVYVPGMQLLALQAVLPP